MRIVSLGQSLFSGKNKKTVTNLLSAEFAKRRVQVKMEVIKSSKIHTVFTLSIQTPQHLTILVLNFEQVQFTTRCCVLKLLDEWQIV